MTRRDKVKEVFTLLAQEEARHKLNLEFEYDLATF
jgi:rubrerythrin